MNTALKAKRAGRLPARLAKDRGKRKSSLTTPNCTPLDKYLSSLISQASEFMNRAEARGDSDCWVAHFTIWQNLYAARYGLPWPGVTNG